MLGKGKRKKKRRGSGRPVDGDNTPNDGCSNAGDSENEGNERVNIIYGVPINNSDEESLLDTDGVLASSSTLVLDAQMKKPPVLPLEDKKEDIDHIEYVREESLEIREETHEIVYNKRALPKEAPTYELERFGKHALLIFNQCNIEGYVRPRLGTERDVEELEKTFKSFGFEVETVPDLTKEQIRTKLKEFSSRDFTDYGCVAVAVLTHGSRNGLLRAKDTDYSELTIINQLQVHDKPTLVTKPKLVIIQACRGYGSMQGTTVRRAQGQIMKDLDEEEPYTLPVESDMLVLHSSYIGKPSVRDELEGSWFIQSLCKKINELASTHDLESIMTEVRREVAIDRVHEELNRRTDEMDVIKQMPVATSTLIRKLYLKNPVGDSPGPSSTLTTDSDQPPRPFLDNSVPNTPLLVQFGPCSCFLEHFNYIIDCLSPEVVVGQAIFGTCISVLDRAYVLNKLFEFELDTVSFRRHFLNDNPDDVLAQSFLEMADTFEDSANFNSSKEKLAKAVCAYLKSQVNIIPYFKFLYFYKH